MPDLPVAGHADPQPDPLGRPRDARLPLPPVRLLDAPPAARADPLRVRAGSVGTQLDPRAMNLAGPPGAPVPELFGIAVAAWLASELLGAQIVARIRRGAIAERVRADRGSR